MQSKVWSFTRKESMSCQVASWRAADAGLWGAQRDKEAIASNNMGTEEVGFGNGPEVKKEFGNI